MNIKIGNLVKACVPGKPDILGVYIDIIPDIQFDPQAKLLMPSGEFYSCHPSWLVLA